MHRSLIALISVLCAGSLAPADDWPGFRGGAQRTAVSSETGLARSWPNEGPPLRWTSPDIGSAHSGVAVVGDTVYTLGRIDKAVGLVALNARDGSIRWHVPTARDTASTPEVVDGRVVIQSSGVIYCHSAEDGHLLWKQDLAAPLKALDPQWRDATAYNSWAASPTVTSDRVFVVTGHPACFAVALDAKTGRVLWKVDGVRESTGRGWGSAALFRHGGRELLITPGLQHLAALDPASGKILWQKQVHTGELRGCSGVGNVPVCHQGAVFAFSAYGQSVGLALLLTPDGNTVASTLDVAAIHPFQESVTCTGGMLFGCGDVAWTDFDANADLLVNGQPLRANLKAVEPRRQARDKQEVRRAQQLIVYRGADGKGRTATGLACADARSGKVLGVRYGLGNARSFSGPMTVAADGMLYVVWSWDYSRLYLLEATAAMTVRGELAIPRRADAFEGRNSTAFIGFTAPSLSGGRLFLRFEGSAWCYDVADAQARPK